MTHQSLERGLRLVELVASNGGATSLGYLRQDTETRGYELSASVYRDGSVTVVAKREPDGPVRVVQDVGARRPLHRDAGVRAYRPGARFAVRARPEEPQ